MKFFSYEIPVEMRNLLPVLSGKEYFLEQKSVPSYVGSDFTALAAQVWLQTVAINGARVGGIVLADFAAYSKDGLSRVATILLQVPP
jgi:hypothetical protein